MDVSFRELEAEDEDHNKQAQYLTRASGYCPISSCYSSCHSINKLSLCHKLWPRTQRISLFGQVVLILSQRNDWRLAGRVDKQEISWDNSNIDCVHRWGHVGVVIFKNLDHEDAREEDAFKAIQNEQICPNKKSSKKPLNADKLISSFLWSIHATHPLRSLTIISFNYTLAGQIE